MSKRRPLRGFASRGGASRFRQTSPEVQCRLEIAGKERTPPAAHSFFGGSLAAVGAYYNAAAGASRGGERAKCLPHEGPRSTSRFPRDLCHRGFRQAPDGQGCSNRSDVRQPGSIDRASAANGASNAQVDPECSASSARGSRSHRFGILVIVDSNLSKCGGGLILR